MIGQIKIVVKNKIFGKKHKEQGQNKNKIWSKINNRKIFKKKAGNFSPKIFLRNFQLSFES